jgi:hypothetical protein
MVSDQTKWPTTVKNNYVLVDNYRAFVMKKKKKSGGEDNRQAVCRSFAPV